MNDRELARAHVTWFIGRLRMVVNAMMDVGEVLLADNFEHGVKHGREAEREKADKEN